MKYKTLTPTLKSTPAKLAPQNYTYMIRDKDIITANCYWRRVGSEYTWIAASTDIGMTPDTIISVNPMQWEWIKPVDPKQLSKAIVRTVYRDGSYKAQAYKTIAGAKKALNVLMYNKNVANISIELL
jgi:hypothetical protein